MTVIVTVSMAELESQIDETVMATCMNGIDVNLEKHGFYDGDDLVFSKYEIQVSRLDSYGYRLTMKSAFFDEDQRDEAIAAYAEELALQAQIMINYHAMRA